MDHGSVGQEILCAWRYPWHVGWLYGLCVGRRVTLHGGQLPPRLDVAQICCFLSSLASKSWNNYEPNEDKKPAKLIFDVNLLCKYFGGAVESLITMPQHFNCAVCFWNTSQPSDWVIVTIPWMSRISKIAHGETERERETTQQVAWARGLETGISFSLCTIYEATLPCMISWKKYIFHLQGTPNSIS